MAHQSNSKSTNTSGKHVVTLSDAMKYIAHLELPWPEDIFGKVPTDDWSKIHNFAEKELGYPIDRISGDLMRRGWKVHERMVRELLNDLVEPDVPKQAEDIGSRQDV